MTRRQIRYDEFEPASEQTSRTKRKVRATDTKAELLLRRQLWRMGLRYRVSPKNIPGKPDIAFIGRKLAIFVDGDFWHGRDWPARKQKLKKGSNPGYWTAKIESNIDRDRRKTEQLEDSGWTVLRFWETDILRDVLPIATTIANTLNGPD